MKMEFKKASELKSGDSIFCTWAGGIGGAYGWYPLSMAKIIGVKHIPKVEPKKGFWNGNEGSDEYFSIYYEVSSGSLENVTYSPNEIIPVCVQD